MRRYETIIIIDPDSSEEDRKTVLGRISDLIQKEDGFFVLFDEWGNRKLAYEIKKKNRGHYVRVDYCGSGHLVNEMERFFKIDDRLLKYMTIQLDKSPNLDQIKEELAETKAKEELAEAKAREAKQKAEEKRAAEEKREAEIASTPPEASEPEAETDSVKADEPEAQTAEAEATSNEDKKEE